MQFQINAHSIISKQYCMFFPSTWPWDRHLLKSLAANLRIYKCNVVICFNMIARVVHFECSNDPIIAADYAATASRIVTKISHIWGVKTTGCQPF